MSAGQKEQTMSLGRMMAAELKQESAATRRCLERLPAEKFEWKPHEKSMSLGRLAGHIVEMTDWIKATIDAEELDFAKFDYTPKNYTESSQFIADLDAKTEEALEILNSVPDEAMGETWTLRNGEQIYFQMPKAAVLRSMVLNHIVHHRGQLAVYMRLLDIPVPGLYGPSADEQL